MPNGTDADGDVHQSQLGFELLMRAACSSGRHGHQRVRDHCGNEGLSASLSLGSQSCRTQPDCQTDSRWSTEYGAERPHLAGGIIALLGTYMTGTVKYSGAYDCRRWWRHRPSPFDACVHHPHGSRHGCRSRWNTTAISVYVSGWCGPTLLACRLHNNHKIQRGRWLACCSSAVVAKNGAMMRPSRALSCQGCGNPSCPSR